MEPIGPEDGGAGARGAAFISRDPAFARVRELVDRVKDALAPVLITGESGTGKEMVARAIHSTGARREGPFVPFNCAAVPETLLESELFGHARGAFTGAVREKAGLLEEAHGGTFFLDEVADLAPSLQVKLLRVLEDRTVRRVGANRGRPVDVRFVSATNRDVEREVARGAFREDLYYRLKIVAIELPPLRERKEDILPLARHFAARYARSLGRPEPDLAPDALDLLFAYPWPGNVRELQNEIQRALILAGERPTLGGEHLSRKLRGAATTEAPAPRTLREARAAFEKKFLGEALIRCGHHRSRTAEAMGVTRQGLFKLMRKYGLMGRPERP